MAGPAARTDSGCKRVARNGGATRLCPLGSDPSSGRAAGTRQAAAENLNNRIARTSQYRRVEHARVNDTVLRDDSPHRAVRGKPGCPSGQPWVAVLIQDQEGRIPKVLGPLQLVAELLREGLRERHPQFCEQVGADADERDQMNAYCTKGSGRVTDELVVGEQNLGLRIARIVILVSRLQCFLDDLEHVLVGGLPPARPVRSGSPMNSSSESRTWVSGSLAS